MQRREHLRQADGGRQTNVPLGLLVAFLGGFLFSFDLPLLRLAGEYGGNGGTLVLLRGAFLFVSITCVWWIMRINGQTSAPFWGGLAGVAVAACNTVAPIAYIGAVETTGATNVVLMIALVPLMTAMLSHFLLREPVSVWTWSAAAATFAGVSIIVADSLAISSVRGVGDLLALISGLCTAIAFTVVRATGKNLMTSLGLGSLCSAIIAFSLGGAAPAAMPLAGWAWAALGGLIIIPAATMLVANGPRYLPSVDVSMFFLLETLLTPAWMYFLFDERISPNVFAGGTIVVLALLAHSGWRMMSTWRSLSPGEVRK